MLQCELFPQRLPRPAQARHHGPNRDGEYLRNFAATEALHHRQKNHCGLIFRRRFHRLTNFHRVLYQVFRRFYAAGQAAGEAQQTACVGKCGLFEICLKLRHGTTGLFLQGRQRFQHFLAVRIRVDLCVDLTNDPRRIDQKCVTGGYGTICCK